MFAPLGHRFVARNLMPARRLHEALAKCLQKVLRISAEQATQRPRRENLLARQPCGDAADAEQIVQVEHHVTQ